MVTTRLVKSLGSYPASSTYFVISLFRFQKVPRGRPPVVYGDRVPESALGLENGLPSGTDTP